MVVFLEIDRVGDAPKDGVRAATRHVIYCRNPSNTVSNTLTAINHIRSSHKSLLY